MRCPCNNTIFRESGLLGTTYQGSKKSQSIGTLLEDEEKGDEEKGLTGTEFHGTGDTEYNQKEQSEHQVGKKQRTGRMPAQR